MRAQTKNLWNLSFALLGAQLPLAVLAMNTCIVTANAAPYDGNAVIVHTDAGDVTVADVRANLDTLPPLTRVTVLSNRDELSKMVQLIGAQRLAMKAALSKGVDKKPDVASAVMAAEDRARTDVILRSYMADETVVPDTYPSQAELQTAYDANKAAFSIPKTYRYSQILVAVKKDAGKADEDKAAAKLANIQSQLKVADANFGAIAAVNSDDPFAENSKGDVGAITEERIPAEIRPTLEALKLGMISEAVRTTRGWVVIKLVSVTEARQKTLDEVGNQLRTKLRNERAQQAAKITINAFVAQTPTPSADALSHLTSLAEQ